MLKVMMEKLNGCIFWLKMIDLLEKYNTIWDKVSGDIKKKNLIASLSTIKNVENQVRSHGDEVTDFYDKGIPKVDSNHTFFSTN